MTYRESNIEITVRHESSPIVEIILKNGAMRFFRTTMSCPNMAMAEEYARYTGSAVERASMTAERVSMARSAGT